MLINTDIGYEQRCNPLYREKLHVPQNEANTKTKNMRAREKVTALNSESATSL